MRERECVCDELCVSNKEREDRESEQGICIRSPDNV